MSDFFSDDLNAPEDQLDPEVEAKLIDIVRRSGVFEDLLDDDLKKIVQKAEVIKLSPDQSFLEQYQEVFGTYILPDLAMVSEVDRYTKNIQRSGLFGEIECISGESKSLTTVIPTVECEAVFIPRDHFLETIRMIPSCIEDLQQKVIHDLKEKLSFSKLERSSAKEHQKLTQEVLENMGVGCFSINQAGEIGHNYNHLAEEYIGKKDLAGIPFADVAFREDRKGLRNYYQALQMLFSGNQFDPVVIIGMLPEEVTINERILRLRYSFVQDMYGNVLSVFIRMEDLTMERKLADKELAEKNIVEAMQGNIGGYLSMLKDVKITQDKLKAFTKNYIKNDSPPDMDELGEVMRSMHSSKGLCGQFELENLKMVLHNLEEIVQHYGNKDIKFEIERFGALADDLKKEISYAVSLKNNLGSEIINLLQGINFSVDEYDQLLNAVNNGAYEEVRKIVNGKTLIPAERIFENWKKDIERLAGKNQKSIDFSIVVEPGLKLKENIIHTLNVELGHIYRNCVDHGIESPEIRKTLNKEPTGKIKASVKLEDDKLIVILSDDGAGLDTDKIINIARNKPNLSQEKVESYIENGEIWKILFLPGFSSSEKVTSTSGRGVGLDAVWESIRKLNGQIIMQSKKNIGSAFKITIPVK